MTPFALRQRLRQWWQSRLPATDCLALTHRNVYILPTAPGLMLVATLLVLLVASINYQLNLGYLLTFLLAGSALAAMHLGHATLRGLQLSLAPPAPRFAGTGAPLGVTLTNASGTQRPAIALAALEGHDPPAWAWCDVPERDLCTVEIALPPLRRGLHPLPALTAETRFPLGTFRVWTVWRPAARVLVYPAPEASPPPLPVMAAGATAQTDRAPSRGPAQASGEFDGVRAYRRGDTMRSVAWKKAARAGELVARDLQPPQRQSLWLALSHTGGADLEHRLSRLTAWVLQAERLGLDYGLRLPAHAIDPGHGPAHQHRCLEALALC